jgi:hypothetical protein
MLSDHTATISNGQRVFRRLPFMARYFNHFISTQAGRKSSTLISHSAFLALRMRPFSEGLSASSRLVSKPNGD